MGVDRFLVRYKSIDTPYYQEPRPSIELRDLVACLWVRVVRLEGAPSLSPIIPDGCADIMVHEDAPPCVAGPDATTRWTSLREGTVIAGIRVLPGDLRSIFGCPAGLILNRGALLSDLAPGAGALHHRLRQPRISLTVMRCSSIGCAPLSPETGRLITRSSITRSPDYLSTKFRRSVSGARSLPEHFPRPAWR
jgi:uncharacterized protein DUF6597